MNTGPMFLVYQDEAGELHYQPWQDVTEAGTLIDEQTGDDMPLIGWATETAAGEQPASGSPVILAVTRWGERLGDTNVIATVHASNEDAMIVLANDYADELFDTDEDLDVFGRLREANVIAEVLPIWESELASINRRAR